MEPSKLAEALAKAQLKIQPPKKNRDVDFLDKNGRRVKYSYADLADLIEAVKPLHDNGISYFHQMEISEHHGIILKTTIRHSSGEELSTYYPLPDPTAMKPQEFGSSLTYGRRYSLSLLVGVASEEDDDGAAALPPEKKKLVNNAPVYKPKPEAQPQPKDEFFTFDPDSPPKEKLLALQKHFQLSAKEITEEIVKQTGRGHTKDCSDSELNLVFEALRKRCV